MQEVTYKDKNKIIANISLCLSYDMFENEEQLVNLLIKDIRNSSIGYAGFKSKDDLHDYLMGAVFDYDTKNNRAIPKYIFNNKEIVKIIKSAIEMCHKIIPAPATNIFVFLTFSKFVRKRMDGTTGYTPYKNTILVFINPLNKKWRSALKSTVAHEFSHSVFLINNKWSTLLDSLIFEGLAENFRGHIIDGKKAPWVKVLNAEQTQKILSNLKRNLHSKSQKLYNSVFWENKKYPLWGGYAVGYHIIQSFIKSNPNIAWEQIHKMSPKNILEKSKFIKTP